MTSFDEIRPILKEAAKVNFWAFCCYMDWSFFAVNRRFLKEVAISFQYLIDEYKKGNAVNISISMPPRSGKSYIISLASSFWLATFPELSVMRNACTERLFQKFSYDTRAIIRSEKFKEIFPDVKLSDDKQNLNGWNLSTSKQVGYFGAGVGGTIIGFGANLAITDDLYKSMEDALSSTVDEKVKLWKQSAHDSRKEKNCPEIFIGTRWAQNDVIGEAIDSGDLRYVIKIPALNESGESFCEDVKSTNEYLKIKESIDNMVWLAEYMQDPTNPEGLLIPKSDLSFYDMSKLKPENFSYRFAVGDPADKGGDKYAMPFIGVIEKDSHVYCYVTKAICNKNGIEINTEAIKELSVETLTEDIFIESNGVGLASILLLKNTFNNNTNIRTFHSSQQKEVRILSHYEFVKKYFIFDSNYKDDKEYNQFITDLTSYIKEGDNTHKMDAIDVCCSAANIVKQKYRSILFG